MQPFSQFSNAGTNLLWAVSYLALLINQIKKYIQTIPFFLETIFYFGRTNNVPRVECILWNRRKIIEFLVGIQPAWPVNAINEGYI